MKILYMVQHCMGDIDSPLCESITDYTGWDKNKADDFYNKTCIFMAKDVKKIVDILSNSRYTALIFYEVAYVQEDYNLKKHIRHNDVQLACFSVNKSSSICAENFKSFLDLKTA